MGSDSLSSTNVRHVQMQFYNNTLFCLDTQYEFMWSTLSLRPGYDTFTTAYIDYSLGECKIILQCLENLNPQMYNA